MVYTIWTQPHPDTGVPVPGSEFERKEYMIMIKITLDRMMAKRHITLRELSRRVGITEANLSILKNNKAKAIRFSTLMALCHELDCQPGDILEFVDSE